MNTSTTSAHNHGVSDVVISCIDYRFRARVADWIKQALNDQADLIAVAGDSKAFLDDASGQYLLNLIKIAVDLHGVTTVHVLDHIDCGAYGGSKMHDCLENEEAFHSERCSLAADTIARTFPHLNVKSHIVTFDNIHACTSAPASAGTT